MRWNLKEAGCGEPTNPRANLWSDEQKSHIRSRMRVRLQLKPKPNNYTESCKINGRHEEQHRIAEWMAVQAHSYEHLETVEISENEDEKIDRTGSR